MTLPTQDATITTERPTWIDRAALTTDVRRTVTSRGATEGARTRYVRKTPTPDHAVELVRDDGDLLLRFDGGDRHGWAELQFLRGRRHRRRHRDGSLRWPS